MNPELRDSFYGTTIDEQTQLRCGELDRDAVRLWQIVSIGWKGFGLPNDALVDYVRRHVLALLARGAKLIVAKDAGKCKWVVVHHGGSPAETDEAITQECLEEE